MTNQTISAIDMPCRWLVAAAAATGLAIFAYGTRGFRRQLKFDTDAKTLSVTKININNQARVERNIPVNNVESVFVKRPEMKGANASLFVRIKGVLAPICAISGDRDEIEALHKGLCDHFSAPA